MRTGILALCSLTFGSLASCSTVMTGTSQTADLVNARWSVESVAGTVEPQQGSPSATIRFGDDGAISGTLLCNSIGGGIRWRPDGRFEFTNEPTVQTMAGCVATDEARRFGRKFWDAMKTARYWNFHRDNLRIAFADGEVAELSALD
ncbi:META domain-containing protein [Pelagerythrobacter marensis]|uniref:META domain-containing protein n=1 Tax=Pelagerythrobacter marensis TaxID=543877 RepID=A0ABZ2D6Y4_9SPHN